MRTGRDRNALYPDTKAIHAQAILAGHFPITRKLLEDNLNVVQINREFWNTLSNFLYLLPMNMTVSTEFDLWFSTVVLQTITQEEPSLLQSINHLSNIYITYFPGFPDHGYNTLLMQVMQAPVFLSTILLQLEKVYLLGESRIEESLVILAAFFQPPISTTLYWMNKNIDQLSIVSERADERNLIAHAIKDVLENMQEDQLAKIDLIAQAIFATLLKFPYFGITKEQHDFWNLHTETVLLISKFIASPYQLASLSSDNQKFIILNAENDHRFKFLLLYIVQHAHSDTLNVIFSGMVQKLWLLMLGLDKIGELRAINNYTCHMKSRPVLNALAAALREKKDAEAVTDYFDSLLLKINNLEFLHFSESIRQKLLDKEKYRNVSKLIIKHISLQVFSEFPETFQHQLLDCNELQLKFSLSFYLQYQKNYPNFIENRRLFLKVLSSNDENIREPILRAYSFYENDDKNLRYFLNVIVRSISDLAAVNIEINNTLMHAVLVSVSDVLGIFSQRTPSPIDAGLFQLKSDECAQSSPSPSSN